jgi:hypothetical protein
MGDRPVLAGWGREPSVTQRFRGFVTVKHFACKLSHERFFPRSRLVDGKRRKVVRPRGGCWICSSGRADICAAGHAFAPSSARRVFVGRIFVNDATSAHRVSGARSPSDAGSSDADTGDARAHWIPPIRTTRCLRRVYARRTSEHRQ